MHVKLATRYRRNQKLPSRKKSTGSMLPFTLLWRLKKVICSISMRLVTVALNPVPPAITPFVIMKNLTRLF